MCSRPSEASRSGGLNGWSGRVEDEAREEARTSSFVGEILWAESLKIEGSDSKALGFFRKLVQVVTRGSWRSCRRVAVI
jgi:hypothetical protein